MKTTKRKTSAPSPLASSHGYTTPPQMKFRPPGGETTRATAKGTKPLPEPISIGEALTKVIVYLCSKILFVPLKFRIAAYAVLLFFISLVADYKPFPRTYFADSSNIPNQYFVKFSWAWTLIIVGLFMYFTASVYCAGERRSVVKHMSRLLVGTLVWWIWTTVFRAIEESTGVCKTIEGALFSVRSRKVCGTKGGRWEGFDISGHAFLLVWCVLFIAEESRAIIGWDKIKDLIRNEDYNRARSGTSTEGGTVGAFPETPLYKLSLEQFENVKKYYKYYSLLANVQLILLTMLVLLWDAMIIATSLYFHSMVEKVMGGLIACVMWLFLYRGLYTWDVLVSPGLPGHGQFRNDHRLVRSSPAPGAKPGPSNAQTTAPKSSDVPHFMGMPLTALKRNSIEGDSKVVA